MTFRLTPELSRRLRGVAHLYGELPSVFLRDMVEAICALDAEKTMTFLNRVRDGIAGQAQLPLRLGGSEEGAYVHQEAGSRAKQGKGAGPP
jgi:hypothetical protein